MKLPTTVPENNPVRWVMMYSKDISIYDILLTPIQEPIQIDILFLLLKLLRDVVRNAKVVVKVKPGGAQLSREMQDIRLREEVWNMPSKFSFQVEFLREINPIQVGEMIVVVLAKLKAEGIDATVENTSPAMGEVRITKPGWDSLP